MLVASRARGTGLFQQGPLRFRVTNNGEIILHHGAGIPSKTPAQIRIVNQFQYPGR